MHNEPAYGMLTGLALLINTTLCPVKYLGKLLLLFSCAPDDILISVFFFLPFSQQFDVLKGFLR